MNMQTKGFRPANDQANLRNWIGNEIDRLIGLLDILDGDSDLEPYLAGWDYPGGVGGSPDDREGDEDGLNADEEDNGDGEESEPSGFGDVEGMIEDMTGENSLGWTEHVDQDIAQMTHSLWGAEDGEPELGWCGHGIGVRDGETHLDTEANGDELDLNGDEMDHSSYEEESIYVGGSPDYDGSGVAIAESLVRGLPTFDQRVSVLALIADGYQPGRSYT